jgi:phosphate transport system protein
MRAAYHEQLAELTSQLGEMCGLAGLAMHGTSAALLQADLVLAEQVIADHETISAMSACAEQKAFVLLARQAPVAGDLRAIVSSIQNVADIERMGALAVHVAKVVRRRHPQPVLPEQVNGYFAEMGRLAVELSANTQEVLLSRDPYNLLRYFSEPATLDSQARAFLQRGMNLAMQWAAQGLVVAHISQTIDSTVERLNTGLQSLKAGHGVVGKVAVIVDRDLARRPADAVVRRHDGYDS